MKDLWLHGLLLAGGLLLLPALCTALLAWAGFPRPGRALVGGMIAGFLLGPGVLGRAFPNEYEAIVIGGVAQRQARDQTISRQYADFLAAQTSGWNRDQLTNLQDQQAADVEPLKQACTAAQFHHQQPRRAFTVALAALTLLLAGAFSIPRSEHRQTIIAPMSIGLWSAMLPGALTYAAAVVWWRFPPMESACAAAAIAIGPWALNAIDRQAADDAELGGAFLVQTAGRMASVLVLVIAFALGAPWFATNGHAIWPTLCLLGLPLGWIPFVNRPIRASLIALRSAQSDSWLMSILFSSLAACAAITIDPLADFSFWPIVVILLLSADGRWLGAFIGAMSLGSRQSLRTMRLILGSMAAGPTQLAVTAIAAAASMIEPRLSLALLLGAVLMEVTTPVHRSFAQRLAKAEQEAAE